MGYTEANKMDWIVYFIDEFAEKYHMSFKEAFRYLSQYKGIKFIDDCYEYAHTQSFHDMVLDVARYCKREGGKLT